jgi:hypothetical protein
VRPCFRESERLWLELRAEPIDIKRLAELEGLSAT